MRRPILTLVVALATLAAAPTAASASGQDVLRDCADDERLSKDYSQEEYADALRRIPSDADQYGNCREVISRARARAASDGGGSGGGGGGGGSTGGSGGSVGGGGGITGDDFSVPGAGAPEEPLAFATPEDAAALEEARTQQDSAPVVIDGERLAPDVTGRAPTLAAATDLPVPVAALLAVLGIALLALGGTRLRSLVRARRTSA